MATTAELFTTALQHYQAGRLPDAEAVLRQILAREPRQAAAWHLLGVLAYHASQLAEAIDSFRRAADLEPRVARYWSSLGGALQALGHSDAARTCHERARDLAPADSEVLNNLGITLACQGQTETAIEVFQQALRLTPADPELHINLATALQGRGDFEAAVASCREAVRLRPGYARAHQALADTLLYLDRAEEAADSYRQTLACSPGQAVALVGLGRALAASGRGEEALAAYHEAVRVQPSLLKAHLALGEALRWAGRWEESLAVQEQALRLRPDLPEAYIGLGDAYAASMPERAYACYESALNLMLSYTPARYKLGLALLRQGRPTDARVYLQEALQQQPQDAAIHSAYLSSLVADPQITGETLLQEHRRWTQQHEPSPTAPTEHANVADPQRRLRVGYMLTQATQHELSSQLRPILSHHDRNNFEIFCYADAASTAMPSVSERADHWRDTTGLSDARVAGLVRHDGMDVLVDLAGHSPGNRLGAFALRPAPVQLSYLGYPATTGLTAMDYRLGDAVTDPEGALAEYTEELIRLGPNFSCYEPPKDAPEPGESPALRRGHFTFGLLQGPGSLSEASLDIMCRVLAEVPSARLLVCNSQLRGKAASWLLGQCQRRGIHQERVALNTEPWDSPGRFKAYAEIDALLAPWAVGSAAAACEALWMGVPILALAGRRHGTRIVSSILSCLELHELIADTAENYCAIAAAVARNLERFAELRLSLRMRLAGSPLCDAAGFTCELEAAYRRFWQCWCQKRPPGAR